MTYAGEGRSRWQPLSRLFPTCSCPLPLSRFQPFRAQVSRVHTEYICNSRVLQLTSSCASTAHIRRIHPADAIPGLQQAVHFRREIFSALGVLRCSAYVIIKRAVRKIPSAEQFPRRCPIHFLAGKMHVIKWGCRHDVSLWRPSCGAWLGREARRCKRVLQRGQ